VIARAGYANRYASEEGMCNMKKQVRKSVTAILILAGLFLLSDAAVSHAASVWWVRGGAWNTIMTDSEKRFYIQGLLDGLIVEKSIEISYKISYEISLDNCRKALDQFYKEYKNELIPAFWAVRIVSMELRGVSKETIEAELRALRSQFHKLQEEKPQKKDLSDK
jgi:hypothetical protein